MAASGLPKQIGRYRIRSHITTTPKSVLFRAYDPVSGDLVALQLFGRPFVTEHFLSTLQRDAKVLGQLNNERLLKVHGAGIDNGHAYLVTEIPPTYTLSKVIADGPISPLEADEVITLIARGLTEIHSVGLLHSQLAPETIYINSSGEPVIGGYCPLDPRESPYAAPEQKQGQPLSARSDVYSLGVLLLYLLTGSPDRNIENFSQLPVSYQDIVRRATSAATLARYSSPQELADALPLASRVDSPAQLPTNQYDYEEEPDEEPEPEIEVELEQEPESLPQIQFVSDMEVPELGPADQVREMSSSTGKIWIPLVIGLFFVCVGLGAFGWWFSDTQLASATATAPPPTMLATAVANATSTPTATPTATPIPVQISIISPEEGDSIDLGQSIHLTFKLSDPIGIRTVNILSNGLLVTSFNAGGATEYVIDDDWTPNWRGGKVIEVVAVNRNGQQLPTVSTTIRVIDRALIARHDSTWNKIEINVSQIRGLDPTTAVFPDMLSRSELQRRVFQDDYFYDEETARHDVIVLHAFDFAPLNYDLYTESRRYLGNSIAGFYNFITKEFVIVSDDDEMDVFDEWTYAHEFMHALQDQHYGLEQINTGPLGFERELAFRSLAEGEASLLQQLYLDLGYFTQAQLVEIYSDLYFDVFDIKAEAPSTLPQVLVNSFWFPYTTGQTFATTLYQQQGWAGLEAAWADVPQSSEQIIHPDRYLAADQPVTVTLPDLQNTLGDGYTLIRTDTFGEFYMREYLSQQLPTTTVDRAATGWGGDQFAVYWNEEDQNLAMMLKSVWDTPADATDFAEIYRQYGSIAYGSVGNVQENGELCWQSEFTVCMMTINGAVVIVRAPLLGTALDMAAALR